MKNLLVVFLTFISITLNSATYYVSTVGNDSWDGLDSVYVSGTNGPWITWGKAATTAIAGDTVYFRGGTYTGTSSYIMNPNSGSAGNYICFFNYPGETPVLDYSTYAPLAWTFAIRPYNDDYLYFKGLTVKNLKQLANHYVSGIEALTSDYLIFENIVFDNIGGPCIGVYGCNEVYFINCDASRSIDELADNPGGNGSGFAASTRAALYGESMYDAHIYFTGCRAWGNGDQGFAVAGVGTVTLNSCWSFDNGRLGGEGFGIKLSIGSVTDTITPLARTMTNCIFALNAYGGINTNNVGGTPWNGHYYNNFVYRNGFKPTPTDYPYTGAGIWICSGFSYDVPNDMWANNISYANEKSAVVDHGGGYYTHEYNSWDYPGGAITVSDVDFISLDTLQLWYPRKANGSLPDITFGKLAVTSDLIDKGVAAIVTRDYNIPIDYTGTAPDLGYAEYSATEPPIEPAVLSEVSTYKPFWLTNTTAQTGGNVYDDGGATVTARGVCWNTTGTPTLSDIYTVNGSGTGLFTATMEGLSRAETYYVRAYATNSEGTAYGNQMTFRKSVLKTGTKRMVTPNKKIIIID